MSEPALNPVPITWQMRDLWVKDLNLAGPSQRFDHEAEFWQWADNVRAGYPEDFFNLDVSAEALLRLWMKSRNFAGPSEKFDHEQGFFQWMDNLRTGIS